MKPGLFSSLWPWLRDRLGGSRTGLVLDRRSAKAPALAVVVPIFNTSAYLIQTLDSIVAGGAAEIDIILVDDGSTDDSQAIARSWMETNEASAVLIATSNRGIGAARNRGMLECRSRYLAFLDSDDYFDAATYRLAVAGADAAHADLVITRAVCFHSQTGDVTPFFDAPIVDAILGGNSQRLTTLKREPRLMRLEVNAAVRLFRWRFARAINLYFPEGILFEDLPPHVRAISRARKILVLNATGLHYRIMRPGQMTSVRGRRRFDMIESARLALKEARGVKLDDCAGAYLAGVMMRMLFWSGEFCDSNHRREYFQRAIGVAQMAPKHWRERYEREFAIDNRERLLCRGFNSADVNLLVANASGLDALAAPAQDAGV